MSPIKIGDFAPKEETVDFWGKEFALVPVTKSRMRRMEEITATLEALEDEAKDGKEPEGYDEKILAQMGEMIDVITQPLEGRTQLASTIVKAKWDADELTVNQLVDFVSALQEAAGTDPT